MLYAISGAGGIGSGVAGFMALAGIGSVMVARPAHSQAVNERGLLDGQGDERLSPPKAVSTLEDVPWDRTDLALLTVKSYDTVGIAESLARLGKPIPPVVCVKNGIDNKSALCQVWIHTHCSGRTVQSEARRTRGSIGPRRPKYHTG